MIDPQINKQGTRQARGKANKIDKEGTFKPQKMAIGQEEVVPEHSKEI
jgi:hypothetical protein